MATVHGYQNVDIFISKKLQDYLAGSKTTSQIIKVVSRDRKTRRQKKKTIYTSKKDFEKYGYLLIHRHLYTGWDCNIEIYKMIDEKFVLIDKISKM